MSARVSIALATFNGSAYIFEQLESIVNQTHKVDEIIVTDDCSSDNTINIVNEFARRYPEIVWKVYINDINLGFRKNFRYALSKCTGDVIFFCVQDDIWREDKVEVMLRAMKQNSQIMLLLSDFKTIDSRGEFLQPHKKLENIVLPNRVIECNEDIVKVKIYEAFPHSLGQGCTMAISKKLANLFLECDLEWAHDNLAGLIAVFCNGAYYIKEQLIYYRLHGNNTIGMPYGKYGTRHNTFFEKCEMFLTVSKHYLIDLSGAECRKQIFNQGCNLFENIEEIVGCAESEKNDLDEWREFERERLEVLSKRKLIKYIKMRIKYKEYFRLEVPICTFEQQIVRFMCDIGAIIKK